MATFFSPACAGAYLQASDGCPHFSAHGGCEEAPEGCSRWGCHQTAARARNCTLCGWAHGCATCRHPLCLERPQRRDQELRAQLSPAEQLAQLAWAAPRAVKPKTELRLACSQTPAIAEVCSTQSSKLHLNPTSLLSPGSAFPAPEVLH